MRLHTITPIRTGYRLEAGVTPATEQYGTLIKRLASVQGDETALVNTDAERNERWKNISADGFDPRVAIYRPDCPAGDPEVEFHIYGSGVAIAEVTIHAIDPVRPDLERWSQTRSVEIVRGHLDGLCDLLRRMGRLTGHLLDGQAAACGDLEFGHTSRALIISETERSDPALAGMIDSWLENTIRPKDGADIRAGRRDHSLTWLNYMIVEPDGEDGPARTSFLLDTMRIAQYFWSAQDWANERTRQIIADALIQPRGSRLRNPMKFQSRSRTAEKDLLRARSRMQMLQVEYESLRGVLNRRKESLLTEIMESWHMDALKANGERLIDLSSSKIKEITASRTRRSEFVTGLILFGIGAVAILEAIFAAISFSREVMLRPALGYTDGQGSFLLRVIAAADSDWLLGSGFVIIFLLTVIYVLYQRK